MKNQKYDDGLYRRDIVGWILVVVHIVTALTQAVTIVGIANAVVSIMMIPVTAFPFGKDILDAQWPEALEAALKRDEIDLMLQVNGKLRGSIRVGAETPRPEIEALALASEAAQKFMEGKAPKKVVVVPGRLVNIVV